MDFVCMDFYEPIGLTITLISSCCFGWTVKGLSFQNLDAIDIIWVFAPIKASGDPDSWP